jgi:glycerol-3-phosphate acyltransferase PlsY
MSFALAAPLTFFIGAIPFGWVAFKLVRGGDVRRFGSGNVGATNFARQFTGWRRWLAFAAVYLLDMGKGFAPVTLLASEPWPRAGLGLLAVAGHVFSPFLGFKGGKGVATASGVLLALDPLAFLVAVAVFGVVFALTRVVALGSIALGFALALAVVLREPSSAFHERLAVTGLACFLAVFLLWTHRSNLRKLVAARHEKRQAAS